MKVNRYGAPPFLGLVLELKVGENRYEAPVLALVVAWVNGYGVPALVLVLVLVPVEYYSKLLVSLSLPYRAQIENFALHLRVLLVLDRVNAYLNLTTRSIRHD